MPKFVEDFARGVGAAMSDVVQTLADGLVRVGTGYAVGAGTFNRIKLTNFRYRQDIMDALLAEVAGLREGTTEIGLRASRSQTGLSAPPVK